MGKVAVTSIHPHHNTDASVSLDGKVCGKLQNRATSIVDCQGKQGRVLKIQLIRRAHLSLSNVDVYNFYGESVITKKGMPTSQSTIKWGGEKQECPREISNAMSRTAKIASEMAVARVQMAECRTELAKARTMEVRQCTNDARTALHNPYYDNTRHNVPHTNHCF